MNGWQCRPWSHTTFCVYAVCSGLPVRKRKVNTVCEQERSRSANKATESDKSFNYINMDIFYSKNAPVMGQRRPGRPRECLGWVWLVLSAHATKAHFTLLHCCLFLSLSRIGQLFHHWFFVWLAAYLKHVCHTSSLKRIYTFSGGGKISLSKLFPYIDYSWPIFQKGLLKPWKHKIIALIYTHVRSSVRMHAS